MKNRGPIVLLLVLAASPLVLCCGLGIVLSVLIPTKVNQVEPPDTTSAASSTRSANPTDRTTSIENHAEVNPMLSPTPKDWQKPEIGDAYEPVGSTAVYFAYNAAFLYDLDDAIRAGDEDRIGAMVEKRQVGAIKASGWGSRRFLVRVMDILRDEVAGTTVLPGYFKCQLTLDYNLKRAVVVYFQSQYFTKEFFKKVD